MLRVVEVEVEIDKRDVIEFLETCSPREYVTILMEAKRGKGTASSKATVEGEIITDSLLELAEVLKLSDLEGIEKMKGSTTIQ